MVHGEAKGRLQLCELTEQQLHWYETEWLPKKEVNGECTAEDLVLINALKAAKQARVEWDKTQESISKIVPN